MRKIAKKLSAMTLCTVFASMQIAAAAIDTGLGNAVINNADGGFAGINKGTNSATLNFNGDSHVNWNTLNVGKGETLNFNAIDGKTGITVLNTVNSGMTEVYGAINSNEGIAKVIISNPNGMLYDGAKFTTAGDLMLTTQALGANFVNGKIEVTGLNQEATKGIAIKNTDFTVGGEFNVVAPSIEVIGGYINAAKGGLKLVTADGQNYLVAPTTSNDTRHEAVRLQSVKVDGNVYIASGKDIVKIVDGAILKGDLTIQADGNVGLNYVDNGNVLEVTGDVTVINDARTAYLKNAKVGGNVNMSNSGGFVEVANVNVDGDVNLSTSVKTNSAVKHFVHVLGENNIKGNLNVDSIHNVHIGTYDDTLTTLNHGKLTVGGDINAVAREGSVKVTVDTSADKVALTSGTLNIMTDGKAVIKANEYQFEAKHFIGGVSDEKLIIDTMENYTPLKGYRGEKAFVNIDGGNVTKIKTGETGHAFVRANNSMNVNGVDANKVNLSAGKDIVIGKDAKADVILVDGETRNLTVETPSRDYTLKYTNIKDTEVITVKPTTEITYDMANGENGWNKGTQTKDNTYLVVPGNPATPDPQLPTDNDNVKVLNNLQRDQVNAAIDAGQVYTPVAFAADLDEEIDTGVRKNVDGSVTVVRAFTPSN